MAAVETAGQSTTETNGKLNGHVVVKTNEVNGSASDQSSSESSDDAPPSDRPMTENERKILDASTTYYPHPTNFKLSNHAIDEVAVIGAGISGLTAGALFPLKVPGIRLTIFEKNADVGGVWFENIYPGVRCDIPAHSYQSSFCPNTQWTEEYATGEEIAEYWKGFARKYDVYSKIKFSTKVTGSYWDAQRASWRLELNSKGERSVEHFDFVVQAIGRFNSWRLPEYPGMDEYKGHLVHASNWDPSYDCSNKRVAVIGNGASGVQIVPALRTVAAHIDHYIRNPTWVASAFTPYLKERQEGPMYISKEDREAFKDEDTYVKYRKHLEDGFWRTYDGIIDGSETAKNVRPKLTELIKKRLAADEDPTGAELFESLVPVFPPHCRRLTPAPGYLESLTKENVTTIQSPIERFTEEGIVTKDGEHYPVDAVICCTGANTDCCPPTPIVSGEYDLAKDWKMGGKFGFPYSYMGLGVPGFPNMSFILGPNPAGPTGTLVNSAETQVAYIAKWLRKMSSQGIRTMAPSKQAADDFVEFCDAFFPRTNLTKKCSSWSNSGIPGARIHGHWPGSAAHLNYVRREPRWEDFEYTYVRPENRFAYFGDGWTKKEKDMDSDMTLYIRKEKDNDLRNVHELWWDL